MTKQIPLTQGKVALVSDHRYEYLMQWKWRAYKDKRRECWYALRNEPGKFTQMHRVIMDAPDGVLVDHRDGDGLNNVDENLRLSTKPQNHQNSSLYRNSSTGLKGVSLDKKTGKYKAYIQPNRTFVHLGRFDSAEEAGRAYDRAAIEIYGEFARTNFAQGGSA